MDSIIQSTGVQEINLGCKRQVIDNLCKQINGEAANKFQSDTISEKWIELRNFVEACIFDIKKMIEETRSAIDQL